MGLKNVFTLILFDGLLLAPFLFAANAIFFLELGNECSFSYDPRAPNGPQNWGTINPNWTLCGTGRSQSPINIDVSSVVPLPVLGDLTRAYRRAPALIIRGEHDIEVEWTGDAGGIVINGTEYKLQNIHWHIPSEHTINGRRYKMELHIVHTSLQGDIAVIGILYNLGLPDPLLARFVPLLPFATKAGTPIGDVDLSRFPFEGRAYYRYNGSLTTPPCSENVTWSVLRNVGTVSFDQLIALRAAVGAPLSGNVNARPIQPLNGRTVNLYEPMTILNGRIVDLYELMAA